MSGTANVQAAYPGKPGAGWQDDEGACWVLCADGKMRLLVETEEPEDPAELDARFGPMLPLDSNQQPADVATAEQQQGGAVGDPYDWDPAYAAATIDRLQKALAAATARAESATVLHERWKALRVERDAANKRAEKAEAERDELRAAIVANGSLDFLATLAVKIEGTSAADFKRIVAFRKSGGAPPDGRSEPVERSETSGGIGTASNSSTGTAGLSAACGNKYSYHVCFLPAGHDGDHRDDRYWRWPTHLGTWTSDDATEDGQHG